jgi:hypothetical protein
MKDQIYFKNWRDLEKYGINSLTGESCAYSLRLLCDLNQEGVDLLQAYFGMYNADSFASNWNSTVNGKPAIKSIMLSYELFFPLVQFIISHVEKYPYYIRAKGMGEIIAFSDEQDLEFYQANPDYYSLFYGHTIKESRGGRCVHQFTGRSD